MFTATAESGHFSPMVPLAHSLAAAGHVVAFATAEGFGDVVRRAGFEHVSAGDVGGENLEAFRRLRERAVDGGLSPEDVPQWLIVEYFAKVAAPAMLADR